jgi:hypothetical protein
MLALIEQIRDRPLGGAVKRSYPEGEGDRNEQLANA